MPGNTGDAVVPTTPAQIEDAAWHPPAAEWAAKENINAEIFNGVVQNLALGLTGQSQPSVETTCPSFNADVPTTSASACYPTPPAASLAGYNYLTYQTKYWTCGPAATLLVLWQMTGSHQSEDYYANEENTVKPTPGCNCGGTYIGSISHTLTREQSFDYFYTDAPSDKAHYLSYVTTDSYYEHHELVNNVQTKFLSFWHGISDTHFDDSYGYDDANGGFIYMAEEYDPTRAWGTSQRTIDSFNGRYPYGTWKEPLTNAANAVMASPSHEIVW